MRMIAEQPAPIVRPMALDKFEALPQRRETDRATSAIAGGDVAALLKIDRALGNTLAKSTRRRETKFATDVDSGQCHGERKRGDCRQHQCRTWRALFGVSSITSRIPCTRQCRAAGTCENQRRFSARQAPQGAVRIASLLLASGKQSQK